jgi:hypothetical protein
MDLAPSSERLSSHRTDPRRSASPGIRSRCVPRLRHLGRASTPWRRCRHHSANRLPHPLTCSARVVSHHLDGLLRTVDPGLVASQCRTGFAAFHRRAPSGSGRSQSQEGHTPLPATRFTPLEEFPSSAAAPRHRGRCPLAVTDVQSTVPPPKRRCDLCPHRPASARYVLDAAEAESRLHDHRPHRHGQLEPPKRPAMIIAVSLYQECAHVSRPRRSLWNRGWSVARADHTRWSGNRDGQSLTHLGSTFPRMPKHPVPRTPPRRHRARPDRGRAVRKPRVHATLSPPARGETMRHAISPDLPKQAERRRPRRNKCDPTGGSSSSHTEVWTSVDQTEPREDAGNASVVTGSASLHRCLAPAPLTEVRARDLDPRRVSPAEVLVQTVVCAIASVMSSRLRGFAPPTSPWCRRSLPTGDTLSFHGLCSPSRSVPGRCCSRGARERCDCRRSRRGFGSSHRGDHRCPRRLSGLVRRGPRNARPEGRSLR